LKLIIAKGKRDRRSPIVIEDSALVPELVWAVVYGTDEYTSHFRALVRGTQSPTREQFAEIVASFIANDAFVYSHFSSYLGGIPDIVAEADRLALKHDPPSGDPPNQTLFAEVNKAFVYNAFRTNASGSLTLGFSQSRKVAMIVWLLSSQLSIKCGRLPKKCSGEPTSCFVMRGSMRSKC